MSLFDVPEEDRTCVLIAIIIGAVLITIHLFSCIRDNQEKVDAFKNGYEEVYDPLAHKALWKKKDHQ
jgi:hypothetical protein